jgi:hypothetical protein
MALATVAVAQEAELGAQLSVGPVLLLSVETRQKRKQNSGTWKLIQVADEGGGMPLHVWECSKAEDARPGDIVFLRLVQKTSFRGCAHLTAKGKVELLWREDCFERVLERLEPCIRAQAFCVRAWASRAHSDLLRTALLLSRESRGVALQPTELMELGSNGSIAILVVGVVESLEESVQLRYGRQGPVYSSHMHLRVSDDPRKPPLPLFVSGEALTGKLSGVLASRSSPPVVRVTNLCGRGSGSNWHLETTVASSVTVLDPASESEARSIQEKFCSFHSGVPSPVNPSVSHPISSLNFLSSSARMAWVSPLWILNALPIHLWKSSYSSSASSSSPISSLAPSLPPISSSILERWVGGQWILQFVDELGECMEVLADGRHVLSNLLGCNMPAAYPPPGPTSGYRSMWHAHLSRSLTQLRADSEVAHRQVGNAWAALLHPGVLQDDLGVAIKCRTQLRDLEPAWLEGLRCSLPPKKTPL